MTVERLFELYEAAKAGKKINKVYVTRGYIENFYDRESCNFLNEDLNEMFKERKDNVTIEYEIIED